MNNRQEIPEGALRDISDAIEASLKELISKKYEKLKGKFIEELEHDQAKEIGAIAIHLSKEVCFQSYGESVTITVRKEQ